MPGSKVRILSTRPLGVALLGEAAGKGVRIDTLSFIVTDPVRDQSLTSRVLTLGKDPLTAVFTSMNAVQAVAGYLRPQKPADWRIYCIGGATREQVQNYFGARAIAGTASSAAALADVILQQEPPSELFFFCGDQRREELPEKLSAAGIQVKELKVYTTIQTPHYIERKYDGILFFSPSAVHSFFSMNSLSDNTHCFAIGNTTADAIRTYCSNSVITSEFPEKEELVRQMIDYFQTNI